MPSVLVVEDSRTQSTQIRLMLKHAEFEVYLAENGREALDILKTHQPDMVLTDLQMPEMDGLELVQVLRDQYPHLPVVLMTQHGSEEIALAALRQGAASYLPKNQLHRFLVATLDDILESTRVAHGQERIQQCRFRTEIQYRLPNDPALMAPLSAQIEQELVDQHFANPTTRRQIGVALRKALDNAIYHGNLELGADERAEGELVYRNLAEVRRQKPPWCERSVWVTVTIDEAGASFTVRDEGPGFDAAAVPGSNGSANLDVLRGSGLLLIRTFMDEVRHNALGNEITMVKRRPAAGDPEPPAIFRPAAEGPRLFKLETLEDTLLITLQSENVGFAELGLPQELDGIFEWIHPPEIQHVLVDFSQIDYFSSSVLEAASHDLAGRERKTRADGGVLALARRPGNFAAFPIRHSLARLRRPHRGAVGSAPIRLAGIASCQQMLYR